MVVVLNWIVVVEMLRNLTEEESLALVMGCM